MKAIIKNGNIEFVRIPAIYKNLIGFNKMSDAIHLENGFFPIIYPPFDSDLEYLSAPYFDEEKQEVSHHVLPIILPDINEAKAEKIDMLKVAVRDLYSVINGYVIEKQIHGEAIPAAVKNKIKSIRAKYQQVKSNIEALTTVVDVIKFQLPYDQIRALKNELEDIE